jgi:hypothetical protein
MSPEQALEVVDVAVKVSTWTKASNAEGRVSPIRLWAIVAEPD